MAKHKGKLPAAAARSAQPAKPNPFELKKTRTKFAVVGRRIKGTTKNVVQARQDAHNKRKATLLVEYKQLRKANTFKDMRLGEAGDMTEDERALAKLQALRMKQARKKKGKFTLSEGAEGDAGGEGLTHLGKSLADMDDLNEAPPSLNDLDDDMVADLVATYNFGGGAAEGEGGRKTRKQVMEEIIAKSKMYKAMKAKQKEEDEQELNQLDDEFRALIAEHSLKDLIKPAGYMKGIKLAAETEDDAAYDVAARSLAAEARGAASERTLTPGELEAKERDRLQVLERERQKRMRGDVADGQGDAVAGDEPLGGYAARRKRLREKDQGGSSDEEGDSDDDEEEEDSQQEDSEGGEGEGDDGLPAPSNALEARRRQQAAGDHPLQDSFREQAAALLAKYGVNSANPLVKKNDVGSDDEGEDEDEEGEDEEGEGETDEEEGEEEVEEDDSSDAEEGEADVHDSEGSEGSEEEGDEGGAPEEPKQRAAKLSQPSQPAAPSIVKLRLAPEPTPVSVPTAKKAAATVQQSQQQAQAGPDEPLDLPYTIPLPETYEAFAKLVAGRPAHHMLLAIQRIRAFNAPKLASDSKKPLQTLYNILVQHFALLAGQSPLPMAHLDALLTVLLPMTGEVPFYAATVARARLQKMHDRLSAALKAQHGGTAAAQQQGKSSGAKAPDSAWPSSRIFLQLRLFSSLFPLSDRRHPVVTPLSLLVSKYLSQCCAQDLGQLRMALLVCGLAVGIAGAGQRYAPEPLNFLTDAIRAVAPVASQVSSQQQQTGHEHSHQSGEEGGGTGGGPPVVLPGTLTFSASGKALKQTQPVTPSLIQALEQHASTVTSTNQPAHGGGATLQQGTGSDVDKAGLLQVVFTLATRAARGVLAACGPAAPAALAPLLSALQALGSPAAPLPDALEQARAGLLAELQRSCKDVVASRKPLVQAARIRAPVIKQFNPRFEEEGFALGRDYDPDRVRADQKKLRRALAKEKRGAMRELRRDGAFLAAHRDRERAAVDAERMENQKKFYAELQSQEADMRSGGQKGMNPHKKSRN